MKLIGDDCRRRLQAIRVHAVLMVGAHDIPRRLNDAREASILAINIHLHVVRGREIDAQREDRREPVGDAIGRARLINSGQFVDMNNKRMEFPEMSDKYIEC